MEPSRFYGSSKKKVRIDPLRGVVERKIRISARQIPGDISDLSGNEASDSEDESLVRNKV